MVTTIMSLPKHVLIDAVLPYIGSVKDYIALVNTCFTMSDILGRKDTLKYVVKRMLLRNLDIILGSFHLNNDRLRSVLSAIPGSILSGSSVLQAFLGEKWPYSDLDIYIPHNTDVPLADATINNVITALKNNLLPVDHDSTDGHQPQQPQQPQEEQEEDIRVDTIYGPYIHEAVDGCLSQVNLRNGRKIQLIFVKATNNEEPSASYIVKAFDLTNVQNWFDGNTFHARYIDHVLTRTMEFSSHRMKGVATDGTSNQLPFWFPINVLGSVNLVRLEKYENRGFRFNIPNNFPPPLFIDPHMWSQIQKVFERDLRIRQLEEILPLHIHEVLLLHDKAVDSLNYQHAVRVKKLIRNNEHLLFTLDTEKGQFRRQKLNLEKKLNKKRQKITRLRSIIKGQKQLDQEQQASSLVKSEIRMDDKV
jgi:hypothetical protein